MEHADLILHNATVLTMDDDYRILDPCGVGSGGDSFLDVGFESDILEAYTADESIDCEKKILLPGLINAHTHVPMTLLRGLADDLRLDVWLMGFMMPVEREFVSP